MAECGYDGGYTTVQKYVMEKKSQLKSANGQFLKLEWAPGEAQVDFGVCDFRVLGVVREVHYLMVTFPLSNVSLAQRFWGETSKCVCEGLRAVFEFLRRRAAAARLRQRHRRRQARRRARERGRHLRGVRGPLRL